MRAGKMTQWLKASEVLIEKLSSFPSSQVGKLTPPLPRHIHKIRQPLLASMGTHSHVYKSIYTSFFFLVKEIIHLCLKWYGGPNRYVVAGTAHLEDAYSIVCTS